MATTDASAIASPYIEYLKSEGYLPELDEAGVVRFKREGLVYLIVLDASDPDYFPMVLPNFWQSADEATRREALDAINETSGRVKVAKVVMDESGRVSAHVESFVNDAEHAKQIMKRCMDAAHTAAQLFLEKMKP